MVIIFRVIANPLVGSGHVYRSLTLAHEMSENKVLFITEDSDSKTVNKIINGQFPIISEKKDNIIQRLLSEMPDIVINDILDTHEHDVFPLKNAGIRVINFEDLGSGAKQADITINELFETPIIESDNILWGNQYFFVREEFENANPHESFKDVKSVLLSFGGIDKLNCTLKAYLSIKEFCKQHQIKISIVTGPGYLEYEKLEELTKNDENTVLKNSPGIISKIMEKCEIAITSNGRTVYELAHMNIPSIAIPQHDREGTHEFASSDRGFVVLKKNSPQSEEITSDILLAFQKLVENHSHRNDLYSKMRQYKFDKNRKKVVNLILNKLS